MAFEPPIVSAAMRSIPIERIPHALALVDPDWDWVHFDVCDGAFVPRFTCGPELVRFARTYSAAWFEVHLLAARPDRLVEPFIAAGARQVVFHPQTVARPGDLVRRIHELGARAGVVFEDDVPLERARPWLALADVVLVKTTDLAHEAAFLPEALDRVRLLAAERERAGLPYLIEADGRLALDNLAAVQAAGADVFVLGETVFGTADPASTLATARAALRGQSLAESPDGVTRLGAPAPAPRPITFLNRRTRGR
ncbi:MAG: hypothetical protein U0704_11235 [Candidatus Eisenbacteria bacterium]